MSPDLEPQKNAGQQQQFVVDKQQQEVLGTAVERVTASVAVVETSMPQQNGGSSGLDTANENGKDTAGAAAEVAATSAAPVKIEDMDEELLQEQAQEVVEELQKRGACTTLALAKMLGMEKSTQLNPLLCLLLEKNVVARVTDFPPIWSLSPTFPMSFLSSSAPAAPVPVPVPRSSSPAPSAIAAASPFAYTSVQPARHMAQQPPAVPRHTATGTIITFPPIPADRTKPVITFPPIPAETQAPSEPASLPATSGTLQQADYWQSLSQMPGGKNHRNGGGGPPLKKWKKQKNLSELQLRLLKELKERGPTRTLELSKLVGLVTTRDVNPSIYDLKHRNLVVKVNNAPPVWQLNEPGMNMPQLISGMEVDEDEDQSERDTQSGAAFGGAPIAVNSQEISSLSFFH